MRIKDGANYILVGSMGGAPTNPVWVYNLRARPAVEIRDHTEVHAMRVREVDEEAERARLWKLAVAAFPPYAEYQAKTTRRIPVFVAEPIRRAAHLPGSALESAADEALYRTGAWRSTGSTFLSHDDGCLIGSRRVPGP